MLTPTYLLPTFTIHFRAMETQDMEALEKVLAEAAALSIDNNKVQAAHALLLSKREYQAEASLLKQISVSNNADHLTALANAIATAKTFHVRPTVIFDAETKYTKIENSDKERKLLDDALDAAIRSRSLLMLDVAIKNATTAGGLRCKNIHAAIALVNQIRNQDDKARILVLLKDAIKMRSVKVLEQVIKVFNLSLFVI